MPAKKGAKETPQKKNQECDELLFSTWCVTNRRGLYVHSCGHYVIDDHEHKGELTKIGTVEDVSYSAVYNVKGEKTPVFKLYVCIPEWENEEEEMKWYVVREIDFRNLADSGFRAQYLFQPEENGCSNVDKALLDAWAVGVGGTKGNWFKNWFNNEQFADSDRSAPRNRPARTDMPAVFGGQAATSSTTLPAAIQQPPNLPTAITALPTVQKVPPNAYAISKSKCVCVLLWLLY